MIHGKLEIFFQMFLQISRTPDFERSFRVKRCSLYAGVYGTVYLKNIILTFTMFEKRICCYGWAHIKKMHFVEMVCRAGLSSWLHPGLWTMGLNKITPLRDGSPLPTFVFDCMYLNHLLKEVSAIQR